MINYRPVKQEDVEDIKLLCDKNKIGYPHPESFILIAEEGGKVIGFTGLVNLTFIEPFISENPLVANNLYNQALGILINQKTKNVFCYCDKEKQELFEKFGFVVMEKEKLIMRKEIV